MTFLNDEIRCFAALFCVAITAAAAAAESTHSGHASVYVCREGSAVTYADRPCAADAKPQTFDDANVSFYQAPAVQGRVEHRALRPARRSAAAKPDQSEQKKHEHCMQLSRRLETLDSKMRAGYRVRQGERMREQRTSLLSEQHDLRCR